MFFQSFLTSASFPAVSQKQRQALLRRYHTYDRHEDAGIPLDVCLAMPEFAGNKLVSILIHDYMDDETGRMHVDGWFRFCNFLSGNTSASDKKKGITFT